MKIAQTHRNKLPESKIRVSTGAASSSVGAGGSITAYTYSATEFHVGKDISYTRDTTNGDSFTINAAGVYTCFGVLSHAAAGGTTGFTRNNPANNVVRGTESNVLVIASDSVGGISASPSVTVRLYPGDVIRIQSQAANTGANNSTWVELQRIL
jgi:hypothetical protein